MAMASTGLPVFLIFSKMSNWDAVPVTITVCSSREISILLTPIPWRENFGRDGCFELERGIGRKVESWVFL